jgi:hypothetical protein
MASGLVQVVKDEMMQQCVLLICMFLFSMVSACSCTSTPAASPSM